MAFGCACAPVPAGPSFLRVAARVAASSPPELRRPPAVPAVLPAANRMRHSGEFRRVLRSGTRVRLDHLVLHQAVAVAPADAAPLVGLVVGRSVGNSVVRHRVSRRLRAQLAQRLDRLPLGSGTVVRALPSAAHASSAELGSDLDHGLRRLAQRTARTAGDTGVRR